MRLAKAGYGGGDPRVIEEMDANWVVKILEYEVFGQDYNQEYDNLNYPANENR